MKNYYNLDRKWAAFKVTTLANVFGITLSSAALDVWAEQVLKIVSKNEPDMPLPDANESRRAIGTVRPGEWLFDYWAANYERFPKPVQLRRIYCRYWPPADGVEVSAEGE